MEKVMPYNDRIIVIFETQQTKYGKDLPKDVLLKARVRIKTSKEELIDLLVTNKDKYKGDPYVDFVNKMVETLYSKWFGEEIEDDITKEDIDNFSLNIDLSEELWFEVCYFDTVRKNFILSVNSKDIIDANEDLGMFDWVFKFWVNSPWDFDTDTFFQIVGAGYWFDTCILNGLEINVKNILQKIKKTKKEKLELFNDNFNTMSGSGGSDLIYISNLILNNIDSLFNNISKIKVVLSSELNIDYLSTNFLVCTLYDKEGKMIDNFESDETLQHGHPILNLFCDTFKIENLIMSNEVCAKNEMTNYTTILYVISSLQEIFKYCHKKKRG